MYIVSILADISIGYHLLTSNTFMIVMVVIYVVALGNCNRFVYSH